MAPPPPLPAPAIPITKVALTALPKPKMEWTMAEGGSLLVGRNHAWINAPPPPPPGVPLSTLASPPQKSSNTSTFNWTVPHAKGIPVAAFDFDDTLVRVNGKHVFPKSGDDWKLAFASIPAKLAKLHHSQHRAILILSNQKGTDTDAARRRIFQQRVHHFISTLHMDIPIAVLAATKDDLYRKPRKGMFDHVQTHLFPVDHTDSYYVGDAAGRIEPWLPGSRKDHADTDLKFALNCGLQFYTPEQYFLGMDKSIPPLAVDIRSLPRHGKIVAPLPHETEGEAETWCPQVFSRPPEVVVFCGPPASGKSSFAAKYFPGYVHINQDSLRTKAKCMARLRQIVGLTEAGASAPSTSMPSSPEEARLSVVIDNTNPTRETRADYISIAKAAGYKVRIFHFATPIPVCHHNNIYRFLIHGRDKIPSVVFHTFAKKWEPPSADEDEGIEEVRIVYPEGFIVDSDWVSENPEYLNYY